MKKVLSLFLCWHLVGLALAQTDTTAFQTDIAHLLEETGAGNLGMQMAQQMMNSFQQIYPDVPSDFWDEFSKKLSAEDLTALIIPIYQKYYTHDEVLELRKFYQTPIGKKTIAVLPQLTQESMMAGQEWCKQIGLEVDKELRSKGLIKK